MLHEPAHELLYMRKMMAEGADSYATSGCGIFADGQHSEQLPKLQMEAKQSSTAYDNLRSSSMHDYQIAMAKMHKAAGALKAAMNLHKKGVLPLSCSNLIMYSTHPHAPIAKYGRQ